jgi:hypothetical protein
MVQNWRRGGKPTTFIEHLSTSILKAMCKERMKLAMNFPKALKSSRHRRFVHRLSPLDVNLPFHKSGHTKDIMLSDIGFQR